MRILFSLATFIGSVLLFLIQPMAAKMLLPIFGGSPAVWTAAMLFFQVALLGGYAYAHFSNRWLTPNRQRALHLVLIVIAFLTLPFSNKGGAFSWATSVAPTSSQPAFLVFALLGLSVGLSYFIVSAGAPTLQRWFATTDDKQAHDPYFLYAISNIGSMIGLFGYPFYMEPSFPLGDQASIWRWGFAALGVIVGICAIFVRPVTVTEAAPAAAKIPWSDRRKWILWGAIPTSLLLGATSYISSNIAPMPLIWVVPLAIYLLTFILAFASKQLLTSAELGRILPILLIPLAFTLCIEATEPLLLLAIFHLIVLFVAAWMCHARLAENRPGAQNLTEFYLWLSVGGAVGGLFNSIIAPVIFRTYAEYPLALVLVCLLRPQAKPLAKDREWLLAIAFLVTAVVVGIKFSGLPPNQIRSGLAIGLPLVIVFAAMDRVRVFAIGMGLIFFLINILSIASPGKVLSVHRSFFGVHRVVEMGSYRSLLHGNTIHGRQLLDPKRRDLPLTYYYPSGPIGQVFTAPNMMSGFRNVGFVGLGVGSLASYGQPGQNFTFYEIDPVVLYLARDSGYFTFLKDSKANINYVLGDARLTLANAPDHSYDLLVLDAFSSDAIPTHLLTLEALQMYKRKLAPHGIIAFHISNRYLELGPVLALTAKKAGMETREQLDGTTDDEFKDGKTQSNWTLLMPDIAELQRLQRTEELIPSKPNSKNQRRRPRYSSGPSDWNEIEIPMDLKPWTDEYVNILGSYKPSD